MKTPSEIELMPMARISIGVIQRDFKMFNNNFSIDYDREPPFYGSLQDIANRHRNDAKKNLRETI